MTKKKFLEATKLQEYDGKNAHIEDTLKLKVDNHKFRVVVRPELGEFKKLNVLKFKVQIAMSDGLIPTDTNITYTVEGETYFYCTLDYDEETGEKIVTVYKALRKFNEVVQETIEVVDTFKHEWRAEKRVKELWAEFRKVKESYYG